IIAMKYLICGTHPNVAIGYANIVFNLVKELSLLDNNEVVIFGFDANSASLKRAESLRVKIISPYYEVKERFGESLISKVITNEVPDVVIIYNDILIVSA